MARKRNGASRVRYAVIGAGWFGQAAILPAFKNAKSNSELAAIVSGDEQKRAELGKEYGVPTYPYEQLEQLLASGEVDAVYIATPNSEHREPTLLAARHGVHVLCEKPLADTAAAAEEMTAECDRRGVLLMTAYRLHFEKAHTTAVETIRSGEIGNPRVFSSTFTQVVEEGNTRLDPAAGGHPLLDIGIYCINAARYLFRDEPVEVTGFAVSGPDPKFSDLPESVGAVLRFPAGRVATFVCSFGAAKGSSLQVVGTKGDVRMDPAYSHSGPRKMWVTVGGEATEKKFKDVDQIGPEIVYFSDCVLTGKRPEPDGREGVIDLRVIEAVMDSVQKGRAIPVPPAPEKPRPDAGQQIEKPKVSEPGLVNAAPPSGG